MRHHFSLLLIGCIALILMACSTTKWSASIQQTDGLRYVQQLVKSLPFEIDSVYPFYENQYFIFENEQALQFAPDYEIHLDSIVYGMNGEIFRPDARQRMDVIWRNVYVQPSRHRLICLDRIIIGERHVGVVYFIQTPYNGLRYFPSIWYTTSWECTDWRNTMLLDGFYKGWMENTFDILLHKK